MPKGRWIKLYLFYYLNTGVRGASTDAGDGMINVYKNGAFYYYLFMLIVTTLIIALTCVFYKFKLTIRHHTANDGDVVNNNVVNNSPITQNQNLTH